jgi:Leucine-rich repeat (LRR) protein
MLSCKKEEIPGPQNGGVTFSIDMTSQTKSTAANSGATPSAVIISAEDMDGNQVYQNKQFAIEPANSSYNTKTVQFEAGSYKLTKFMVVDADGNALSATPMGYSSSSSLVNDPLPIKFSVQKGYVTQISPNVLSTLSKNPEEFGYTSFSINQIASYWFQLGVYVYNSNHNQFELTTGTLSITSNTGEVAGQNLAATIDSIKLKEADQYIMSVSKDGYQTWTDTLTANDLLHFYTTPFAVTLDKADESSFSFVTLQDSLANVNITVQSSDNQTPMRINWGDGNLEISAPNNKLTHTYTTPGTYAVRVTGNISAITNLVMTNCQIAAIDLDKATGLKSIDISRNNHLKSLNLNSMHSLTEVYSMEGNLENLNLSNSDSIESVYCSINNLKNIELSSLPRLKNLYCDRNSLTALDVSNNTNLQVLYCYKNALTDLNITNNSALKTLDCRNNQLTSVDISKSLNLNNLLLADNTISNDEANKILADLLNNVKLNPRTGKVSVSVTLNNDGKAATENLETNYQWSVSTN